jgi:regulator of replication initiation timing
MEWMQEMLRAVPQAAKYRRDLEQLAAENARLKLENAALQDELAQYIEQWETLDGDAVNTLRYLAATAFDSAQAIATTHDMNIQIAEMYLHFLVKHAYVAAPTATDRRVYDLTAKGRRYLQQRGFLG